MTELIQRPLQAAATDRGLAATDRSDIDINDTIGDTRTAEAADYAKLKQLVKAAGLLEKRPLSYAFRGLALLALAGLSIAVLVLVESFWLQLLNAILLAFVFAQIGFVGHDTGHQQVFRSPRKNNMLSLVMNLTLGLSRTWWVDKHNRHHSNPNQLLLDPDTFIPILAFSEGQALSRRGFYRMVVRWQVYLFLPMLLLQGFGVRLASLQYVMRRELKYPVLEPVMMAVSLVPFVGLPIYFLGVWQGLVFVLVQQMLFGLYLSLVFAPNHKGMPILDDDSRMGFLRRQVLTARNIRSHAVTDFLYGGLNYQIEHHLFPNMPRSNLKRVQKIVRSFCESRSISYYETGTVGSLGEILRDLNRCSAPLRKKRMVLSGEGS